MLTLALKQLAIFTNSDEDNNKNSVKYLRWGFLLKQLISFSLHYFNKKLNFRCLTDF